MGFNIGAGLSAMGGSIANTASEMSLLGQKEALQEQSMRLANQLSGGDIDRQTKALGLIQQKQAMDAYLKLTGHPGGLSEFGIDSGSAGAAGENAPTTQASAAQGPQQTAAAAPGLINQPASQDGGGSSAPAASGAAPASGGSMGGGTGAGTTGGNPAPSPVITPLGGKGKPIGIALPPGWTPAQAAIAGPQALADAWKEWSKPQNLRANASLSYYDFASGQQKVLYQQPDAPKGTLYDPDSKSFVKIGNADAAIEGAAFDTSKGTAQGSLGAELTKIGAQGTQARETAGFQKGLDVATNLVDSYDPVTQTTTKVTLADALKMAKAGRGPITPPAGVTPSPNAGNGPGMKADGSYVTSSGAVIPPPPAAAKGRGLQAAPSAADKATQESYAPTIKDWEDSIQPSALGEQRFLAMADALKATQSGVWAQRSYDIAQTLGIPKLAGTSVADAQIILKNNFGAALNNLAAAKMGRITQNEIFALQKNLPGIGLQPEANLAIIAQGVGTARWQQDLANGWNSARQIGYADPLTYQEAFMKANPLQGYIDKAAKEIGPLKGGASQYPAPPAAAIADLKRLGPSASQHFDQIFGPGAASRALGNQ